jgi:light-regulated signal transduction histidine kinase (bacteriophytochrome)
LSGRLAPQSAADFAVCEAERIDAPGAIQAFGQLIALDRAGARVTHVSSNAAVALTRTIDDVVGMDAAGLAAALGMELDLAEACAAMRRRAGDPPGRIQPIEVARDERATYLLSLGIGHFLLERRPEPLPDAASERAAAWLAQLPASFAAAGANLFALAQAAVERVREFVGFDRVMIYRFAEDWVGEVIGEAAADDQTPYLGLHYPATDIPSQARRLYLDNLVREIVDTQSLAVPLRPPGGANSAAPVDLSTSILRAISPYHLEYMNNMGVRATLVASIVIGGALWGLVTCHHRAPRQIPAASRTAFLAGARMLAEQLARLRGEAERTRAKSIGQERADIERLLNRPENCVHAFLEATIAGARAEGAMLSVGHNVVAVGRTPPVAALPALRRMLVADDGPAIFAVDQLHRHLTGGEPPLAGMCGAAGFAVASDPPTLLILFREEFAHSVDWGGDPGAAAEVDPLSGKLSPRRSFATWSQTVTERSRPWEGDEIAFLEELAASGLIGRFAGRLDADTRALPDYPDYPTYPDAQGMAVMNAAVDGMTIGVADGPDGVLRTLSANRAMTRMFGLDPDEVRSMKWGDLLARMGVREPPGAPLASSDVVAWSPRLGLRNIVLRERSLVDSLIEGEHQRLEMQIFQDVTRLRRKELALTIALRQAELESEAKTELLARLSHELRTPLNAVIGFSELIGMASFGPHASPKYSEYALKINKAGMHLLALMDQALLVSQIQSGHRALEETEFELGELAAECVAWVAERSAETNPAITMARPRGAVRIWADVVAMRQIALNLIGNAAKFTPPTGRVTVTVTLDAMGGGAFVVSDDGPGIAPGLIADLFTPFHQSLDANAGERDGVGLGLSIVKGLVELHGGTVRIASSEGAGAEVTVLLPRTRVRS